MKFLQNIILAATVGSLIFLTACGGNKTETAGKVETPEPEEVMSPGNVDNKTITELRKVLEETIGAAGADDYMVFMKSVNKTAKLIPDEATRFKASAETLGVSSDAVAKSSSKYLDRLKTGAS